MNDELGSISIDNYVDEKGDSTNVEMKAADEESGAQQKVKSSEEVPTLAWSITICSNCLISGFLTFEV